MRIVIQGAFVTKIRGEQDWPPNYNILHKSQAGSQDFTKSDRGALTKLSSDRWRKKIRWFVDTTEMIRHAFSNFDWRSKWRVDNNRYYPPINLWSRKETVWSNPRGLTHPFYLTLYPSSRSQRPTIKIRSSWPSSRLQFIQTMGDAMGEVDICLSY